MSALLTFYANIKAYAFIKTPPTYFQEVLLIDYVATAAPRISKLLSYFFRLTNA